MKSTLILAAIAAILTTAPALPALAQDHSAHAKVPVPQRAEGTGVIKAVDAKGGTVTIAHDPIPALKWGAMTMRFKVASAAVLKGVAVGRKVHFVMENRGGKPVVTQIHGL
jgi:Cu(I)/Ag(I) efflux system periplasmic protein CusF